MIHELSTASYSEQWGHLESDTQKVKLFGPEYPKINTLFKRDERGRIIEEASDPVFDYLKYNNWRWTEKVDGTNIRLHWNGENLTLGGRTDNADVPSQLINALAFVNNTQIWRETFPGMDDVTVYGEGYGGKIQKGRQYREEPALVVFDILIGSWWLRPWDVESAATELGLALVPFLTETSLQEAATTVKAVAEGKSKDLKSGWPNAEIEGLVGTPTEQLFTRKGERIITKLKLKDFRK